MPNTPQEFPKKPAVSLQALEQKLAAFANESLAKTTTKEFEFNEICKRVMMQARVEFAPLTAMQSGPTQQAFELPITYVPLPRPRVPTSTPAPGVYTDTSGVPYVMGSSKDGSLVPGTYTAPPTSDLAQTDTWSIDAPPKNAGGVVTNGVTINQWVRYYITGSGSGTFTQKVFTRQEKKDRAGKTYYISAETLAETDTESGSGSANGGL